MEPTIELSADENGALVRTITTPQPDSVATVVQVMRDVAVRINVLYPQRRIDAAELRDRALAYYDEQIAEIDAKEAADYEIWNQGKEVEGVIYPEDYDENAVPIVPEEDDEEVEENNG